jgi:hypothetical protein
MPLSAGSDTRTPSEAPFSFPLLTSDALGGGDPIPQALIQTLSKAGPPRARWGEVPKNESPSGPVSVLRLTNPAMSKAPGVNPIPEPELASPSCGDRCPTIITPQLGDVVPAPQETSAHALNFAGKRPLTPTAVRASDSLQSVRQLISRHCALNLPALVHDAY